MPEAVDASTLLIVLIMVPCPGEKADDLSVTHSNDAVMTLANSVGIRGSLSLAGSVFEDGSFAGP